MNETKTAADTTFTIRRTFKAPRERVFAAFTDASIISRWMGPPGTAVSEAAFEPREGGTYRVVMQSSSYGEMTVTGVVTALRRPEHLAYTWRWAEDDPADERDTFVRIDFVAHGDETEIVFTHDGFADAASRDRHDEGWNGAFGKIDAVL